MRKQKQRTLLSFAVLAISMVRNFDVSTCALEDPIIFSGLEAVTGVNGRMFLHGPPAILTSEQTSHLHWLAQGVAQV